MSDATPRIPATAPFEHRLADGGVVRGDELVGDAPGYLYLHGLGSVRTGLKSDSLLRHAAAYGRAFVRVDMRGHGASTGTIGQVKVSDLIADAGALLARLGPRIVVGSSLGGLVAAFAAAAWPERVRGLGLLAPALGFMRDLERLLDAEGRLTTSDGRRFPVLPDVLADAQGLDEGGLGRRITAPTLIVHGSADEVVPATKSERLFATIEHARKELWIVPGGDHRLVDQAPAAWPRLDRLLSR